MKRCVITGLGLLSGLMAVAIARGVGAEPVGDPYLEPITNANVFGLKPIPPPATNFTVVAPPPQAVSLVGTVSVFGVPQALIKIGENNRPVDLLKDPTVVLKEGEREKDVEIVKIDAAAGKVTIKNRDTPAELTIDTNVNKLIASAAPIMAMPGMVGLPGSPGFVPPPGMVRPTPVIVPPAAIPAPAPAVSLPTATPGLTTLPNRPTRSTETPLTAQQQAALIELERIRTADAVRTGTMPPLPPTPLTPVQPQ